MSRLDIGCAYDLLGLSLEVSMSSHKHSVAVVDVLMFCIDFLCSEFFALSSKFTCVFLPACQHTAKGCRSSSVLSLANVGREPMNHIDDPRCFSCFVISLIVVDII